MYYVLIINKTFIRCYRLIIIVTYCLKWRLKHEHKHTGKSVHKNGKTYKTQRFS